MARALNHRNGGGALDLDVFEESKVPEAACGGETDTEPVRAYTLGGTDEEPVDLGTVDVSVGERGDTRLSGQP
ncbi:hypothetical protein [Mycobacterium porcinum]|uniref:hypothetical protein n=1 Tax=Mycolicibacterium porcinum TaxID=39693 RepID=UPI00084932DB|nr:hypothetical protein BHQ19_20345 [Mycolicibacterium porcinum]